MTEFKRYIRKNAFGELRPWQEGDDMTGVSISVADKSAGSPKPGDMIARNTTNHDDQWLVSEDYFKANYESGE